MSDGDRGNAEFAARHILGATIAWGRGQVYDFDNPNPEIITIEDAALMRKLSA